MSKDQKKINHQAHNLFNLFGFIGFVILVTSLHVYDVFRDPRQIVIDDLAVSTRDILIDYYQYHKNVKKALYNHDSKALQQLINAWCGGAAGCYSHGGNLVQILNSLGDKPFSEMCVSLSKKELSYLGSYLAVGHEYGKFPFLPPVRDKKAFETLYPKTMRLINHR